QRQNLKSSSAAMKKVPDGDKQRMPAAQGRMESGNWRKANSRWVIGALVVAVLGYLVLLVPDSGSTPRGGGKRPFAWKQDAFWAELENRFNQARAAGCQNLHSRMATASSEVQAMLDQISNHSLPPEAPVFTNLETGLFQLAPMVAACPEGLN